MNDAARDTPRPATRPLVVHVAPYDAIGGVEVALRSMREPDYDGFAFRRFYLTGTAADGDNRNVVPNTAGWLDSPVRLVANVRRLLAAEADLLIVSLWRSVIAGLLVKLVRPRTRLVVFVHLATDVHVVDALVHRLAFRYAEEIWGDSQASLDSRVPAGTKAPRRLISFMIERHSPCALHPPAASFVFWGRLHAQKRVDRALRLFAVLARSHADATFTIIGPDGGERPALGRLAQSLGIADRAHFIGAADADDIRKAACSARFYLQASDVEGMAISVVEAMQFGLVPVVTPVGEIANYVTDGVNGIVIGKDDDQTALAIQAILGAPGRYAAMRDAAIGAWTGRATYRQDVAAACSGLVDMKSPR